MARELTDINESGELNEIKVGGAGVDQVLTTKAYVDAGLGDKQDSADLAADMATILESGTFSKISLASGADAFNDLSLVPNMQDLVANKIARWRGQWASGQYLANEMVNDDGWLMIAKVDTTDRAAPQPAGDEFYLYDGTGMVDQTANGVKQIVFGTRYTAVLPFYLNGYRIEVVAGNFYEVISVVDPLGTAQVRFLNAFTADTTGWREFGIVPDLHPAGTTFDLMVIVQQPDPAPVTYTGDWSYSTPNNPTIPLSGQITQATTAVNILRVHSRDSAAVDRSAELRTLSVGDRIAGPDISWAIQSVTEVGSDPNNYFDFNVAPAVQSGTAGVQTFEFETTVPVDITYVRDDAFYAGSPSAQGLYVEDSSWENVVPDTNAYGTDILVQNALISPDWDVMASTGSGGSAIGGDTPGGVYEVSKLGGSQVITAVDPAFDDLVSVSAPFAKAGAYEYKFSILFTLNSTTNSGIIQYSTDNTNWYTIKIEAKDTDDQRPVTYFFPIEYTVDTPLNLYLRAAKSNAANTMTVLFADAIIDQKS